MKLISIAGTQGSGKTTLIRNLIHRLWDSGKRSGVIVNEEGDESYDPLFMRDHALVVDRLRGG
jgi:molybdopterin-guanine dinucleotide biosynthesis protein